MDRILSALKKILPGVLPKWILCLTILLSGALYKYFPDLPSSWLPKTEAEKFLIRLLITESCLLLGSVSLIVSLLRHISKANAKFKIANALSSEYQERASDLAQRIEKIESRFPVIDIKRGNFFEDM